MRDATTTRILGEGPSGKFVQVELLIGSKRMYPLRWGGPRSRGRTGPYVGQAIQPLWGGLSAGGLARK